MTAIGSVQRAAASSKKVKGLMDTDNSMVSAGVGERGIRRTNANGKNTIKMF